MVEPSQPSVPIAERSSTADRRTLWLAGAAAALSILPRLPNLGAPPIDSYDFRQTQTAIAVQAMVDGGLRVADYETPVFGPPWQVPFELPTFQLGAAALSRATGAPVDLSCRLSALAWFYLSAWLLFALLRRWAGLPLAAWSLALYLWSPFSIVYSRACLIDYASVALALAYLHLGLRWAEERRAADLAAAVALGGLAYAIKITTLWGFLPPLGLALLAALRRAWGGAAAPASRRSAVAGALAGAAAIALLPAAAGIAWTAMADRIKAGQPATRWLTSGALASWNFSTFAQRTSPGEWGGAMVEYWVTILPGLFFVAIPLALLRLGRGGWPHRRAAAFGLVGMVLPMAVHLNLYRAHGYYRIAVTPFAAVAGAAGLLALWSLPPRRRAALLLVAAALGASGLWRSRRDLGRMYAASRDLPIARLGRLVEGVVAPGRWVAVEGDDWNPRILYLAHRRGFMLRPGVPFPFAGRPEFGALVCRTCPPEVLALWPGRRPAGREAGFEVFRLPPLE